MTELQILVTASAPGKVVLSGEYAVLVGAPAVCMAIDRRARVTITNSDTEHHVASRVGQNVEPCRFRGRDGGIEWIDAGDEFALLEAVWESVGCTPTSSLSLQLDTSEFSDIATGNKTGIGSSAALTVALTAALCELNSTAAQPATIAFDAHQKFQGGRGSGVDIATSVAGGLVQFVMSGRDVNQLSWPDELAYALIWTGAPASTTQKLDRLARSKPRPSRAALVYSARRLGKAWRKGRAKNILNEYHDYINVLREFSIDHDIGIFDAGHAELVRASRAAGLVYKPCGAGGGDVGIVLADNAVAVESFLGTALGGSAQVLDARLDIKGVEAERTDSE
jgi:phosphomevalonate kinase